MTKVTEKNASGNITYVTEYTYDVFDRRVTRAEGITAATAKKEYFVYDGDDVLLDFLDADGTGNGNPAVKTRYLHGPLVNQVLAQEDVSGSVLWMLSDNQGTIRDIVNGAGVVQQHISYDSFGNIVDIRDAANVIQTDDALLTRYLYTGREYDNDTVNYYYRARWYDPRTGRFISKDPIGFSAGDANLYRYVGNGPTNATDPSGLAWGTNYSSPIRRPNGVRKLLFDSLSQLREGGHCYGWEIDNLEGYEVIGSDDLKTICAALGLKGEVTITQQTVTTKNPKRSFEVLVLKDQYGTTKVLGNMIFIHDENGEKQYVGADAYDSVEHFLNVMHLNAWVTGAASCTMSAASFGTSYWSLPGAVPSGLTGLRGLSAAGDDALGAMDDLAGAGTNAADDAASSVDDLAGSGQNAPNSELQAARQRLAGQIDEVGRRRSLGTDPTGQWRAAEEQAALRLEQRVGQLRRDPSKAGDWIDKSGNVYDAVGPVPSGNFNLGSFTRQIDKHLLKQGVDKIVVDLTGLSEGVRGDVLKYIAGLSDAQKANIIIQF